MLHNRIASQICFSLHDSIENSSNFYSLCIYFIGVRHCFKIMNGSDTWMFKAEGKDAKVNRQHYKLIKFLFFPISV